MDTTDHPARAARRAHFRLALPLIAATLIASLAPAARGQDTKPDSDATTSQRDWAYSSRGPARGQSDPNKSWWDTGYWYGSVSAGPAWFGGSEMSDSVDFSIEGRIARDLSDDVYLVGSYTFALAETKPADVPGASSEEEKHDLHMLAVGFGLRLEPAPDLQFFLEPRVGLLVGSDADAAPVGILSAGVELSVTEGIAVRFAVTGFVTDSDIERDGPDANLDSGVMGTLGISFAF
jgi:hypothetical protein